MISDFVKGKKQFDYPEPIQKGIRLHRAIDSFTDAHESTRCIKQFFRPHYRLYAGAFADVVYDYFLANDKNEFETDEALMNFTQNTFRQLEKQGEFLGEKFGAMFPYMRSQNWLYNYQYDWGIQKSMEGLRRRSAHIQESETAFQIFLNNTDSFRQAYDNFFPAMKKYAADWLVKN